jgi:hypothetical protein
LAKRKIAGKSKKLKKRISTLCLLIRLEGRPRVGLAEGQAARAGGGGGFLNC